MQSLDLIIVIAGNSDEYRKTACERLAGRCQAKIISINTLYNLPTNHELWNLLRDFNYTLIVADTLYPRPLESIIISHCIDPLELHCIDTRTYASAEALVDSIYLLYCTDRSGTGEIVNYDNVDIQRWYPVIDKSRCINCSHFLECCLFGVYSNSEDDVRVLYPDNCKQGCPACSRICPQGAIIFPLYDKDQAIAGVPGMIMSPTPEAIEMYEKRTGKSIDEPEDELDRLIDEFDKLQFGR